MATSDSGASAALKNFQEHLKRAGDDLYGGDTSQDAAYRRAAAVLVRFDPDSLRPVPAAGKTPESGTTEGWSNFLRYSEPVRRRTGNWWRLRPEERGRALRELGTREALSRALDANPDRPDDLGQHFLEALIHQQPISVDTLTRDELVALSGVAEWMRPVLPEAKSYIAEVEWALPMADLLAPLQRLAGPAFVGRDRELQDLRDYVGIKPSKNLLRFAVSFVRSLWEQPPLMIHGPGGVGKSTLLARFILDAVEHEGPQALPFVYLDIDRAAVNVERPETFILEAIRQLIPQLPDHARELRALLDEMEYAYLRFDVKEAARSIRFEAKEEAPLLWRAFSEVLRDQPTPVLLVIDTFEEAQFLGPEVVHGIWDLLVLLQRQAPNLRIVVAGRALIEDDSFPVQGLRLTELSRGEAQELLQTVLDDSDRSDALSSQGLDSAALDEIIDMVGLNPMSLRLAAKVVNDQGLQQLRTVETRTWLLLRVRAETLQARLYGRILSHIHDPDVRQLAYPGLLVRRITPDVVRDVLAAPCEISLDEPGDAERLVDALAQEVALVDRDPDGALRHRQDVRRLMIRDLADEVPHDVQQEIHDRAVHHYESNDDPVSRAEEIYHRLKRGDDLNTVDQRWIDGVALYLRSALEELGPQARLWLSHHLGVTPDPELLDQADLAAWEEIAAQRAQRLLRNGHPEEALTVLRERSLRTPGSVLHVLELEVLRALHHLDEAMDVAQDALPAARRDADLSRVRELLLQATLICEAQGRLSDALRYAHEAHETLRSDPAPLDVLHVLAPRIRLLRKLGTHRDEERRLLIDEAMDYIEAASVDSIRAYPALLRDLAAEVGTFVPELLHNAVQTIGLSVPSGDAASKLSEALAQRQPSDDSSEVVVPWEEDDVRWVEEAGTDRSEAAETDEWKQYVEQASQRTLSDVVATRLESASVDDSLGRVVADLFRNDVESTL